MKKEMEQQRDACVEGFLDVIQTFKNEHPEIFNCIMYGGLALIGIAGLCTAIKGQ